MCGGSCRVTLSALRQCPQCQGSGGIPGGRSERCQVCKGQGDFFKTTATPTGRLSTLQTCPNCGGKGLHVVDCCTACHGRGMTRQPKPIGFKVPAGTEDGAVLRLRGQGHASGAGGAGGDALLHVTVQPRNDIERRGMDLHSDLLIPLWIALAGGSVEVPMLQGPGWRQLVVPAGTQHGERLSLAREGVVGKGSHHFAVRIAVPKELSQRETELLEQLAAVQRQRQGEAQ